MDPKAAALKVAKKRIVSLQAQISARILEMAVAIENLTEAMPDREAREYLRVTCNMPTSELKAYAGFKDTLKGNEELLHKVRVSFPVLKALVAADQETRKEALERMEIGARVDTRSISAIRKRLREAKLTPGEIAVERQGRFATAAGRKQGAAAAVRFKDRLDAFVCTHDGDGSGLDKPQIRQDGAEIRKEFESFFGADHPDPGELKPTSDMHAVAIAHRTLLEIERGTLKPERGASGRMNGLRHKGLIALKELTGKPFPAFKFDLSNLTSPPSPRNSLKAIELCAGGGGMALGLERAGFHHVALVEFDKHAAKTLRHNRPDWNVVEGDIRQIDFRQYRDMDIDLIGGGLPCQPYSIEGEALGKDDPRDLFPDSVRVVNEVRPRAFMFENVSGLLHAKHADHVATILRGYRRAGYHTEIHRMQAADYGIAQTRSRILVIGLRSDVADSFRMPPAFPGRRANIGDVLLDLMAANGWEGAHEWARQRREQPVFDRTGNIVAYGAQASTVVTSRGKRRLNGAASQIARGFDTTGLPDRAPTALEAAVDGFLPQLTLKMRARLQGFPDNWTFCGGIQATVHQIGNAVPPRMAMAAGLALFSALKGVTWDWEAVLWPEDDRRVKVTAPSLAPDDMLAAHACEHVG